jgi:hypothetical protein
MRCRQSRRAWKKPEASGLEPDNSPFTQHRLRLSPGSLSRKSTNTAAMSDTTFRFLSQVAALGAVPAYTGSKQMRMPRRFGRILALLAAGGCLVQVTGCMSGLVPAYVSFAESTVLRLILSSLIPF